MTHDKVRVEELDLDASALELAAERLRPGREEGLAARVDGEERRRDEGRERATLRIRPRLRETMPGMTILVTLRAALLRGRASRSASKQRKE